MPRVAHTKFSLTIVTGHPVEYAPGQSIDPEHEDHWFAKHHSDAVEDGAEQEGDASKPKGKKA